MSPHTHNFIETYDGLVGFGMDRTTDENTLKYYLQKFSDDTLLDVIIGRLSDEQLSTLFDTISHLLKKHLSEPEYHRLFLKEDRQSE
ncbi:MAG: cytoplasmic protein [Desulfobacteraceae bacterium]|nr:cytoplasmic protein [Desulfobacteraceae bacterium]